MQQQPVIVVFWLAVTLGLIVGVLVTDILHTSKTLLASEESERSCISAILGGSK